MDSGKSDRSFIRSAGAHSRSTELEKENAELKKKLEAAEKASKNASQPAAPDNATAPENATNAPGDGAGDDKKKLVHG